MAKVRKPGKKCWECGSREKLTFHHVIPISTGGKRTLILCSSCHGKVHGLEAITHSILVKKAMVKLKRQKRRIGAVPYGFDCLDGKNLTLNKREQQVICKIRQLRSEGCSFESIASHLTNERIPTKTGRQKWSHQAIGRIVNRDS